MHRLAALLVLGLLCTSVVPAVAGTLEDELAEVEGRVDELVDRLGDAEAERTDLTEQIFVTHAELDGLLADLDQAKWDLAAVEADVHAARGDLDETRARLQRQYASLELTRIELQDMRQRARRRALQIYMGGGQALRGMVFAADEVTELALGLEYAAHVIDSTDQLINDLEALEVEADRKAAVVAQQERELAQQLIRLEEQRARIAELTAQVAERTRAVEAELAHERGLLTELDSELEFFEHELERLAAEQERIEELIRQEQERGGSEPSIFLRPVPGPVTSGFGLRIHPILGIARLHPGIDLSASSGAPIKAAGSGRVILAGFFGGYGNMVIIDHGGGVSTLYAHQSALHVTTGNVVEAGEVIGHVGSSGLSTGPHLHFEVRKSGTPVDPLPFL